MKSEMTTKATDEEILQKLEDLTKDATLHQHQTLRSIIQRQAAGSRCLLRFLGNDGVCSVSAETFRQNVPLSSYDDYADHIQRMADGHVDPDFPSFSVDPLLCFFYSSGTSSGTMKPKLIPYFDSDLSKAASFVAHQSSRAIFRKLFPPRHEVNKILWFIYVDDAVTTRGGCSVMAASTYPLRRDPKADWSRALSCVSPCEVIVGKNTEHQTYCHLLCALRNLESVDGIRAAYAIGLVRAFKLLECKWMQLCDDLENGFACLEIADSEMREAVTNVLGGPQVHLSKRIRAICRDMNWNGIVSKLWPNVRYMKCVSTGSMKQYYTKLRYYAREVPILGGDYFASECAVGINLDIMQPPDVTHYVMLPTAAYFEFIPFDCDKCHIVSEETKDFSSVEVGKTYEVVVTTYRGLYRYRLGDIVQVVGFHNLSPVVEFLMRAPKSVNDVITERDMMSALESFQVEIRSAVPGETEIVEFTGFWDLDSRPKQLKVFLEVDERSLLVQEKMLDSFEEALKRCCVSMESGLGAIYKVQRERCEVGPLVVSVVSPGTFGKIFELSVKNKAPASQYKPAKIIRNRELVNLMESSAVVTVSLG